MSARWMEAWQRDAGRLSVWLVLLVALASSVAGLGNLFTYDDIPIIVENPMVTGLHLPWEYLADSYWGPSRGNSLYRPLTVIAYALEWAVGNGSPLPFHLANIVLYVLSSLAVLALLRALLPKGAALAAALAWAAHPVHVEAVANVVGQSEMLTALPMLIAVTAYIRDRREGALRARTALLIAACFAWALLTKEHGIVLPALLLAAEFVFRGNLLAGDADGRKRAWLLARILVVEVVVYLVVRSSVLHGFAGDTPHPALDGLPMGERAWVMLALVPEFVRLFWWPVALYADYSPLAVPFLPSPGLGHLAGAGWMALALGLFIYGWRRDRVIAFGLLWIALTMGPISNILVATGVLIAERTLFLPSVGIVLIVGRVIAITWPHVAVFPKPWVRIAVPALAGVILLAAIARSADRQLVWEDNPTLFATTVVDAPNNFRAQHALGELFGAAGAWERAEPHLRTADSLFPGYDLVELSLARVLHFDDRCPEALPIYDRVLAKRPDAEIASIGRTACLLETRQLSDARDEALRGISRGLSPQSFGIMLQKAESSLVATDTVDSRNRWYRDGRPFSKSDARLRVPVLLARPSSSEGGRRMPEP
jgi:hypothetical protein